jgi:hypothetical protein
VALGVRVGTIALVVLWRLPFYRAGLLRICLFIYLILFASLSFAAERWHFNVWLRLGHGVGGSFVSLFSSLFFFLGFGFGFGFGSFLFFVLFASPPLATGSCERGRVPRNEGG